MKKKGFGAFSKQNKTAAIIALAMGVITIFLFFIPFAAVDTTWKGDAEIRMNGWQLMNSDGVRVDSTLRFSNDVLAFVLLICFSFTGWYVLSLIRVFFFDTADQMKIHTKKAVKRFVALTWVFDVAVTYLLYTSSPCRVDYAEGMCWILILLTVIQFALAIFFVISSQKSFLEGSINKEEIVTLKEDLKSGNISVEEYEQKKKELLR